MKLKVTQAGETDIADLVALRRAAAAELDRTFGPGDWSYQVTEADVARGMKSGLVFMYRKRGNLLGTFRLTEKKPWAIDAKLFPKSNAPLYLTAMAVALAAQRKGIGRALVKAAQKWAADWPAECIRLDSYNSAGGAGGFYEKCGFRLVGKKSYRGTPLTYWEIAVG